MADGVAKDRFFPELAVCGKARSAEQKGVETFASLRDFLEMSEDVHHPTGLEWRFERELKAAVPGWKSEFEGLDAPSENRSLRAAPGERRIPRRRPHPRRGPGDK